MSELAGLASVRSELKALDRRLVKIDDDVEQHDKDLYRGDDRAPGVIERVRKTEDRLNKLDGSKTEKTAREWAIFLLLASIFLTQIVDRIWPHK
jgi:hypothetical protein